MGHMTLPKHIQALKEANERRTQGEFVVHRMDGPCGYFNFMVESETAEDHIVAHFAEIDNPLAKKNAEFFQLSANTMTRLLDEWIKMREALRRARSIIVDYECEECGTFQSVRYEIRPIVDLLAEVEG